MDLSTTLVIVLVGVAVLGWLAGARDGRALDAFGLGFLGYRSYGWPRGVQEEDSVHFSFDGSRPLPPADDARPVGPNDGPELIELDGLGDEAIRLRRVH